MSAYPRPSLFIEIGDRSFNAAMVCRTLWQEPRLPVAGEHDERVVNGLVVKVGGGWCWKDGDLFFPRPAHLTLSFVDKGVMDFEGTEAHQARDHMRRVTR
jgi:hypothetical protein